MFDAEGKLLSTIGRSGSIRAPLNFPIGFALNPLSQDLVVCETRLNRLVRIPAQLLR